MTTGRAFCLHLLAKKAKEPAQKGSRFDVFLGSQLMINCPLQAPVQPPRKKEMLVPFETSEQGH